MADSGFLGWLKGAFAVDSPNPPAPAGPTTVPTRAPAPIKMDYEDDKIPTGARERIRRILACLHQVEDQIKIRAMPGFSDTDVQQMRDLHLPKLIKSYIDIPAEHRSEIFRKTGKSASFILDENLDTMQERLDEILRGLAQNDIEAFTNNTKFIGQRYGTNSDPFA